LLLTTQPLAANWGYGNGVNEMSETGIIAALAAALPKLEGAKKDASNPAFKRDGKMLSYATLGSVIDALDPLKDHGLWFLQISHERDNGACFETFAIHGPSSAQMSMGTMFVPADKNNAQGFGSAQSYCRRYGLMAAFGLAAEDDDDNAASQSAKPAQQRQQAKPAALSDADWAKIVSLVQATKTPGDDVKKHVGADNLRLMTLDQYTKAVDMLEGKLADLAKAESNSQSLAEQLGDEIQF
jgi:hypothetical protein